jgi:hypothetical protein
MWLGSNSARVIAAVALGALGVAGCGQKSPRLGVGATSPTGSSATNCGVSLCVSTPSTSSSSSTTAAPPSTATTGTWVPATANLAGLASECGNMSLVSATPDRDMVIAGIAQQGLWTIQNGSNTWTRLGQGAGSAKITNRPSSITYDPVHPNTFWESGIYNSGGAYETVDNGITFKALGNLVHTDYLSVDLSDPLRRTLLSGRHERSNLFKSADGGATWVDISSALPSGVGWTTSPLVLSSSTFLLGTTQGSSSGVFRTADGGATWSRVYNGAISGPALVAKSNGAIYWLLDRGGGIIRSTDQGLTWKTVLGPGLVSASSGSLIQLPDGRLATFGVYVIVSADQGATWKTVGSPMPYTPVGMVYSPPRKAFYIWRFDCNTGGDTSVKADAIERLTFDYTARG